MAESAVNFLIEYMGSMLVDEAKLLMGVRGEVRKIRDELESMRAFLRDADAKEHRNEGIKTWVRQVRAAACDTEDILDEFILRIGQHNQQDGRGVLGFLRRKAHSIKQLKARHQIGKQVKDITVRLSEISKRKDQYNLLNSTELGGGPSVNNLDGDGVYGPRLAALFIEESQLVGIDGPKAWVIDWLLSTEQRLSTMSVVGMGGLGKTTLVKKAYDSVKEHFETYAWITVSENFKKVELLKDMISKFYKAKHEQVPSTVAEMIDMEQLIQHLRDYLQNKTFVLVADDVWEVNAWDVLSNALPAQENGSRVVLTMRRHDVASACRMGPSDCIYELQPLNSDSAWSLFCRRAFPAIADERKLNLSPEMEKLSQSFVSKCGGLPLAIVTLGGLLATKDQTYAVWEMIHRSLGLELDIDNRLKIMMEILWLSFNDLPYYLKSCFLYLSIFPEDTHFNRTDMIMLWMAEGFIEKKEGRTPEEVGEGYINALISRSLIQVMEVEIDGKVIFFRIHDLLREIIISKSGEENLIVSSSSEEKIALSDRVRRLSIYLNEGEMVPILENLSSHLRSFFVFGMYGQSITSFALASFAGLHFLRVLKISDIYMKSLPKDLSSLFHLRYLNLDHLEVEHLPSSIGKLINLETLIIEETLIRELPVEICKLQRLRNLSVSSDIQGGSAFYDMYGVKVPSGVGNVRSLQELKVIEAESGVVGELGKLTQLRTLQIMKLRREYGHDLCTSIEKMSHLKCLFLKSIEEDEEIDLHSLSDPPLTLEQLRLNGHIKELPRWICALEHLRILNLGWSRLKDDPFKVLRSLSNLVALTMTANAYDGEEICVKEGDYPKLEQLFLEGLRALKNVVVEKGAMPNLEVITIEGCEVLMEDPHWLGHLTYLKELSLIDMPMPFLKSLQSDGGSRRADFIQHIPLVSHYDTLSNTTTKF